MATKKNKRCPLQSECGRTCKHELHELECDYYKNNAVGDSVIEDQEELRELQMRLEDNKKYEEELANVELEENDDDGAEDIGYIPDDSELEDELSDDESVTDVAELSGAVSGMPSEQETWSERFVSNVRESLLDIKKDFFRIGFYLWEAQQHRYYRELGFESIIECAEALFDFSKSTTYNLINVYEKCREECGKWFIDEKFEPYSQSQLVELSNIKYSLKTAMRYVKPTDTVAKLKEFRKVWDKGWIHCFNYRGTMSVDAYLEAFNADPRFNKPKLAPLSERFKGIPLDNGMKDVLEPALITSAFDAVPTVPEFPDPIQIVTDAELEDENTEYVLNPDKYPEVYAERENSRYLEKFKSFSISKDDVKKMLIKELNFDYEIKLCGKKQGLKVFFGVIAGQVEKYVAARIDELLSSEE